jgi:DNA-binding MarR family transcriptional regulator
VGEPATLAPRLDATRRALLIANRIGVQGTRAIVEAGLGELSSNAPIAVLAHLADHGPSRPRDLRLATGLTRGGLSNLFDRLESAGLILRTYGTVPGDRRGATAELTAAGASAVATINDAVARTLESLRSDVVEFEALIDSIDGARDRRPSETTTRGSADSLELLSMVGVAIHTALADVDPDDPTPLLTTVVLSCAAQPGNVRSGELDEHTDLSSSGVSQLLARLESADLIHRRTGRPPDRRAVIVELTAHGRRQLETRLGLITEDLARLRPGLRELGE